MAIVHVPVPNTYSGVLVASADAVLRERIVTTLNTNRWPVVAAHGGADALGKLESSDCDVLLLDRRLPDLDADELIATIREQFPGVEVLELDSKTGNLLGEPRLPLPGLTEVHRSLEAVPFRAEAPCVRVERQMEALPGMVGDSAAMQRVYRLVRLVAPRTTTVLVTGPTGSGKELVARAVHQLSQRKGKPFVAINCAAIPEALLESELFGYSRGAFTGAVQSRVGKIQAAQGGTLFLDEIGEMPLGLQSKLLRFLENGELQRLGSNESNWADVRVVAATNANLLTRLKEKQFREDLYFRLSVFPVELPPLSARAGDVTILAKHLLAERSSERPVRLSQTALELLQGYAWPGNVRELMHVLERATILSEGSGVIEPEHLQYSIVPANA
jgi:DNA-binding NtrC family response regulator